MKSDVCIDEFLNAAVVFLISADLEEPPQFNNIRVGALAGRAPCSFGLEHGAQLEMIMEARPAHPAHDLGRIDVQSDIGAIPLANFQHFGVRQNSDRLTCRVAADTQQVRQLLLLGDALADTPYTALDLGTDLFDSRIDERPTGRLGQGCIASHPSLLADFILSSHQFGTAIRGQKPSFLRDLTGIATCGA